MTIPFSQRIRDRVKHTEPSEQVPWYVHDKVKCYRFCDAVGVKRATVFQCQRKVTDLNFDALPDRFVLKPTTGHSAQAIMPLIKDVLKGLYFDLMKRTYRSLDDIVAIQQAFCDRNRFKDSYHILAEEMLLPESGRVEIPHDFKVYVFRDGVGLIMRKNVNARPFQCNAFDSEWRPVPLEELFDFERSEAAKRHLNLAVEQGFVSDTVNVAANVNANASGIPEGDGRPPACAAEIVAVARRVLSELSTPFCRIDVYATLRGCVVGELTLSPGGLWAGAECFKEAWDETLGAKWVESSPVRLTN